MAISTIITVILATLVGAFVLAAGIFLIGKIFGFTFLVLRNIFRFIGAEVTDLLRFISSVLASVLFAPLVVLSIVIGRWSASKHYAGSLMAEIRGATRCVYRFCVGNPARLFGLGGALEGVERRVPEAMAAAPTRDKPSKKRVGMFEGYKIVGSLKGGGSGGKLYIAEPDEVKQAVFAKRKLGEIDQVVIKVFSLNDGSSLPQIVRESRALDAARQLGLVLEHEMTPDRFYYVMRYVPGEALSVVTQRIHTLSSSEGLDEAYLRQAMGYTRDLLEALDTYHHAELWHKDVKPDNIIVDGRDEDARAHLVDFGLVTPMRSAMTLTTHGTEYFRDPELVRQALRGVKVHQIDGSKFDVYAAGAVMYSVIENSFPAHGGLSQITKRCPESLRWIVRRAMAEYDRRYPSAAAMLADLRVVLEADDAFAVRPIDLPSVSEGDVAAAERVHSIPPSPIGVDAQPEFAAGRVGSPIPPRAHANPHPGRARVGRPKATVVDWWSGRYRVEGVPVATPKRHGKGRKRGVVVEAGIGAGGAYAKVNNERVGRRPLRDPGDRESARAQVKKARARVQQRRENATKRVNQARSKRRHARSDYSNTPGVAVVFAGLLGIAVLLGGTAVVGSLFMGGSQVTSRTTVLTTPNAPIPAETPKEQHGSVFVDSGSESGHGMIEHGTVAALPEVDAKVLLIPMLPQPIEPMLMKDLVADTKSLRDQGVDLVGDVIPGVSDERAIELTAELRNELGSTPIDSVEYPLKIQQWLGTQSIDGVLLLLTEPGQIEHRQAMLVTDKFHTITDLNERTVPVLLSVLKGNGYTP